MKLQGYLAICALLAVGFLHQAAHAQDAAGWADDAAPAAVPSAGAVNAAPLPAEVHCGNVLEVQWKNEAVPWRNMEKVLAQKHFQVPDGGDESEEDSILSRDPGDGNAYVIVSVMVKPKRSIGRYDYVITHGAGESPCIALAWRGGPFDQRNWQGVPKNVPTQVELLFEVPAEQQGGELTFKLPVSLPQTPLAIAFPNSNAPALASPAEEPDEPEQPDEPEKKEPEAKKAEPEKAPAEGEKKEPAEKKKAEAAKKPPEKAKKAPDAEKKPAPKPKPQKPAPADDWF